MCACARVLGSWRRTVQSVKSSTEAVALCVIQPEQTTGDVGDV